MICSKCKKDKPMDQFSKVTFTYVSKKGISKTYVSIRRKCNDCTWRKFRENRKVSNRIEAY